MGDAPAPKSTVLNSWKEIANFLGRGVRTAQRWEHDLHMPVRRPRGRSRSAVLAIPQEIETWLLSAPTGELNKVPASESAKSVQIVRASIEQSSELREQSRQVRAQHHDVVQKLMDNLKGMEVFLKQTAATDPAETVSVRQEQSN